MKYNIPLIIFAALVTLGIVWFLGDALPMVWRWVIAVYGGLVTGVLLIALLKE